MKNIFSILFVAFLCLECSSQSKLNAWLLNAWLPEQYVKSVIKNDTSSNKYLIPIEGFESYEKSPHILMYRGEINPLKTKKVTVDDKEKYQLLNLEYYVNLKYNSKEWIKRLSKAKIYISKHEDKILLEIIETDKKEEIYFVDRIDGYEFKSINEAKMYLEEK